MKDFMAVAKKVVNMVFFLSFVCYQTRQNGPSLQPRKKLLTYAACCTYYNVELDLYTMDICYALWAPAEQEHLKDQHLTQFSSYHIILKDKQVTYVRTVATLIYRWKTSCGRSIQSRWWADLPGKLATWWSGVK